MTLLPSLTGAFGDRADLLRVDGTSLSAARLLGAATAVADRIAGADVVAIAATASVGTVVGVVGALLAGVPVGVLVHGLTLCHVHGLVLGVLGALRVGSRLVHTRRPTPEGYAAAGGTMYFGVPTVWSRVVADEPAARALTGARLLVSGSAGL